MRWKLLDIIIILCIIGTIIATVIWGWVAFGIGLILTFIITGMLAPSDSNDGNNDKENKQDLLSQIGKTELMSDMLGDIRGKEIDDVEKLLITHYQTEEELFDPFQEEYFCERCDEKISEEQYIEYAGLCEDCDAEVYFGERYDGDDYNMFK